MTLSFRARLTVRWLLAFGVVLALVNTAIYVGARAFLMRDLDAQLRTLAGTELASASDGPDGALHLHEFVVAPDLQNQYADKFVQLIDASGKVLLQSPTLGNSAVLLPADIRRRALAGDAPIADVSVNGRDGRMVGLVTVADEPYVVAVGLFVDPVAQTLRRLRGLLVATWLGGLALTAIVGFTLASQALVPISRITERAAAIAKGQFNARLDPPQVQDEIGRMTGLLNQMLDRLHGALEANRRFAADASHELRAPLTALLGEIDVTLKRARGAEEYRDVMARLRGRLVELTRLTDDLMLLVRAQESRSPILAEVSVESLLQGVMQRAQRLAADAAVTLHLEAPADLVIYGERPLLERVFDNLMHNAIQYNQRGGSVRIAASVARREGAWVSDVVLITVRNTGIAIPDADRERVFERFYRVDRSRSRSTGGSGLGLAISREIVELFGGAIRLGETGGDGTLVEVQLPGRASIA